MRELRKSMRKRALEKLCRPQPRCHAPKQSCITSQCNMIHERFPAADLSKRCAAMTSTYLEVEAPLPGSIPSDAVAATGTATGTAASRCSTL